MAAADEIQAPVTYGVRNIPTLLVFKNGEMKCYAQSKTKLTQVLESHVIIMSF